MSIFVSNVLVPFSFSISFLKIQSDIKLEKKTVFETRHLGKNQMDDFSLKNNYKIGII